MDRIQEITVFVAVADEQGFAAAARRLKVSAATVTLQDRRRRRAIRRLGTRRRNRANGFVENTDASGLRVKVVQAFGNCPVACCIGAAR